MIKIEETETYGWKAAIRGMRNPKNSWDKSDSGICYKEVACHSCNENRNNCAYNLEHDGFVIGDNDLDLYRKAFRSCFKPTDEAIARAILTGEQMPEAKVVYKDALSEK